MMQILEIHAVLNTHVIANYVGKEIGVQCVGIDSVLLTLSIRYRTTVSFRL